ncbi:NUMOD4 domain-containing protein [Ochrobactrum sp. A-1]|uniref:NUMOD4 domain-containing protein n=1 Tax=Ochrobactrum sp. A-1 TaxID=2920940 RepID=UPI001F0B3DDF|nr:NUMOD4 motif-containing HNH endonuclease [Ochrobactrum sp. A-1]
MEKWLPVVGWEGLYEVSDMGRLRSIPRKYCSGRVLKASAAKNGYLMVSFTFPAMKRQYAYVHRVVAEAFIGPCPNGMEVCHCDGTRVNNQVENLRYGTRSSNALDRIEHGTMNPQKGEAHYHSKLTDDDVRWIRQNKTAMSQRKMAVLFGVSHNTIGYAIRGEWWRHVV